MQRVNQQECGEFISVGNVPAASFLLLAALWPTLLPKKHIIFEKFYVKKCRSADDGESSAFTADIQTKGNKNTKMHDVFGRQIKDAFLKINK